jgi:uncharacterized protein YydD (DUF2326 family)
MIKLTLKEVKDLKGGFDVHLKTEDATTLEFYAGAISILEGYKKYLEEEKNITISDRKLLKNLKTLMKIRVAKEVDYE